MRDAHRIDKVSLISGDNTPVPAVGTGTNGSELNQLNEPYGIFVDRNFNLYVADKKNNRILLFRPGQLMGELKAGHGTPTKLVLNGPTDVILDADLVLYIADNENHRIIRSKSDHFDCIIGCTGQSGSDADQLNKPYAIRFDNYGNLYIADEYNYRVQKFVLTLNFSSEEKCIDAHTTESYSTISNNLCTPTTCFNNGTCREISTTEFECTCALGWDGHYCEIYSFESSSIQTSDSTPTCFLFLIKLIPTAISPSVAWKFRPNENLYISSHIEIDCIQSVFVKHNWTITNTLNGNLIINRSEEDLIIPGETLSDGLYKIDLTVMITHFPSMKSSSSLYIEISRSTIDVNMLALDTSTIRHHYQNDLQLDPGQFSFDRHGNLYNPRHWLYSYYCRIYGRNHSEPFRLFNDSNQTCFRTQSTSWISNNPIHSSITILAESFSLNETYQFLVEMIHQTDLTHRSMGYLIVEIDNNQSPRILISCVIPSMCLSRTPLSYINPGKQFALFSLCSGDCLSIEMIQWNIYQRTDPTAQWTLFSLSSSASFFYGLNSKNLTVLKEFFTANTRIINWRFEVIYTFKSMNISKTFDVEINRSPTNGTCSINPLTGTLLTLFTIHCLNWSDSDGIILWRYYGWTKNNSIRMILGHSIDSIIQFRFPSNIDSTGQVHLAVSIHDTFNSITEFILPALIILPDHSTISNFIEHVHQSKNDSIIVELLHNQDENIVGQLIQSISGYLNQINDQIIQNAIEDGLDLTSMTMTSLDNELYQRDGSIASLSNEMKNKHARVRDYLMLVLSNFSLNTLNDLIFQSSILAQLTRTSNELSQHTAMIALNRCLYLSETFHSLKRQIPLDEIYLPLTYLAECASNVLNSINAVLQGRGNLLRRDSISRQDGLNMEILEKIDRIFSSITSILNIHLNFNQSITIQSSVIHFSLEKSFDVPHLIRRILQPLAYFDPGVSMTNFSRLVSFSTWDENEHEIDPNKPMEFFIPRDPNRYIPPMEVHNVTEKNEKYHFFKYHWLEFPRHERDLTFSLHLEIHPIDENISYFLTYQFDTQSPFQSIDYGTCLTPQDRNNDGTYVHFLNNNQTINHQSIIYGIRQLTEIEMIQFCTNETFPRPVFTKLFRFTSNYQLRIYQSACFYFDHNHQWQSDGLIVGPLTDHNQIQCFFTD